MTVLASLINQRVSNRLASTVLMAGAGALAIMAASQIAIPLPFTPVPITLQTFAVVTFAMLAGRRHGVNAVIAYLLAGALGAPVFSGFSSLTALWGPTSGYLLGFIPAAFVAGSLADRGMTRSYPGAVMSALAANTLIVLCGALVLSAFVGFSNIWALGVVPFLAGDVIKSIAAGSIARAAHRKQTVR